MSAALEGVARSIAPFVRVCTMDRSSSIPQQIHAAELVGGEFKAGAHAFVTKTGKEYRGLVVQRGEMDPADLEAYLSNLKALPPKIFVAALDIVAGKRR